MLTRAALEAARGQLHEDLDALVDILMRNDHRVRECDPVVHMHLDPPAAYLWCAVHDESVAAR